VESHDTVVTELKSKNGELSAAISDLIRLEADDEEAQREKDNPDTLLEIPSVANDPSIVEYKQSIDQLKGKNPSARAEVDRAASGMISLHLQLADAESSLRRAVLSIPDVIHCQARGRGGAGEEVLLGGE